jgi:ferredoxin
MVNFVEFKGLSTKMNIKSIFNYETNRYKSLSVGKVVPESKRCVQCGICSYNCPIGIDVREFVWKGDSIFDKHCLTCGECIKRCPRGVLRFERIDFSSKEIKEPQL